MIFGLGFGGGINHFFEIEVLDNWNCVFFLPKSPREGAYFCALALLVKEKSCIAFWTTNKKGDRMKTNFLNSISPKAGALRDFQRAFAGRIRGRYTNKTFGLVSAKIIFLKLKFWIIGIACFFCPRASVGARILARWLFWWKKSHASHFEQPTKTETEWKQIFLI